MKKRLITSLVAGALFLLFIVYGGLPFTGLIYVLATIGLYELLRMKNIHIYSIPGILSMVLLWVILVPSQHTDLLTNLGFEKMELIFIIVLLLLSYTVLMKNKFTFDDASFLLLATIYVGMGFYYFIETRMFNRGLSYFFFTLFVIWATDSGAYLIGRSFGKRKLWPEISPNKTIEGSLGGVCCAIVLAVVFQLINPLPFTFVFGIFVAIIISVFGQIGDLVESAFKRHYHVKDSGKILPGHGGILDRFDSMLFALPIIHLLHVLF